MNKPLPNVKQLNNRQGGSYTKDPETGKTTLIEQTKHQEITGFEQQEDKAAQSKTSAKKALAK
ncbi:hypothetical protein A9Q81_20710 [Gammaproteobacteria bacterium 42_54_T18]|nr:hypothetical protein A9Q81_20710 [Gammaproteobacteria bacterium 42_54_T18]